MSATYFRNLKCYYKRFQCMDNFYEDGFVILAETSESNLRDFNNKLCWNTNLLYAGTYNKIFAEICKDAYHFETSENQFKPTDKTPEGYIHTLRKLIKDSTKIEQERCPYITIRKTWEEKDEWNPIIEKIAEEFKDKENEHSYHCSLIKYKNGGIELKSSNVEFIIRVKRFMDAVWSEYLNKGNFNLLENAIQIAPYWTDRKIANLFTKSN